MEQENQGYSEGIIIRIRGLEGETIEGAYLIQKSA
jgi:hypothetical protein